MPTNYDNYRVFHRVVTNGSISGAAKELFLSQSTVSRVVQNLERELDSILLERSKQGVVLTEKGLLLFHHVSAAMEHISIAEERLESINRLSEGHLRIGASELTLEYYLLPYLKNLKTELPNVSIQLFYSTPMRAIEDLCSKTLDIAVLASPMPAHEDINILPVKEIRYVLAAGPAFAGLSTKSVTFSEIKELPFICCEKGTAVRTYADRLAKTAGIDLKPEYEVASLPLMMSMVKIDLGLGFVPYLHAERFILEESVFCVNLKRKLPSENICVMTGKKSFNSRIINYFVETILKKQN